MIGVIVPHYNSTFFGDAIDGIESFLYPRGHSCIVGSSRDDIAIEKHLIRKFSKIVDGLIITPTEEIYPEMERLPALGIPTVLMDRQVPDASLSGVCIDNYSITAQAVKLLLEAGREDIALINGPAEMDTVRIRSKGFRETLESLELVYHPEWIFHGPFTTEAGRSATLDLMSLHNRPSAIICTSTDLVAGVLRALKQLRLEVPDDVALVCYGDTIWSSLLSPAITTIEAPSHMMGETSARLLLNACADPKNAEIRHIFLETKLTLRDSHRRLRQLAREPSHGDQKLTRQQHH
jgi:LacI family transcriptional regulator